MATETETAVLMQRIADDIEHIREKGDKTLEQAIYTNGKVRDLTIWRAKIDGGKAVITWVWGALGSFIIAGIVGLVMMYFDFQEVKQTLDNINKTNEQLIDSRVKEIVATYFEKE